ncbi:MAG: recombinase family protein [Ignavibacteriales bacterium]|nr:recombinase family protein [Ignavibacteriales bacterium]
MQKRAALYGRVSGDDRGKDGRNLAGQLAMCREYAQKRGYQIIAELPEDDRGASGASFELPQLNLVREMAQAGQLEVLVVREIDRLSRNLAKQLIVEDELKRAGVSIEYVLGEYPDTPEGNLMKHVRASVAEFERLKIIERMTRGRYLKVKSGSVLVSKHPPFGYLAVLSSDGKKFMLVQDKNEAEVVKLIFRLFTASGGVSQLLGIRQIATRLSELGIPTARNPILGNKSGKWSGSAVRAILSNETYVGIWTYGKTYGSKRNPVEHCVRIDVPSIIDKEVWQLAQKRLKRNQEVKHRQVKHHYLMARRLRCGLCDHVLNCECQPYKSRKTEKVYLYYKCEDTHVSTRRCKGIRCRVDTADGVIWEWVKSLLLNPTQLQKGLSSFREARESEVADIRNRLQVVDDLLSNNQTQLERIIDLYLTGEFEKDLLVERKTRLENSIASLEKEREQIAAQIDAETLTPDQIRTIEEFAIEVHKSLGQIDNNFEAQSQLIDLLDVTGRLVKENGELVIYAQCIIGKNILQAKKTSTCARWRNKNPRQCLADPTEFVRACARRQ